MLTEDNISNEIQYIYNIVTALYDAEKFGVVCQFTQSFVPAVSTKNQHSVRLFSL